MMSNSRCDYGSAAEWLSALKKDEAWLSQLERLENSSEADASVHREDAVRRIGRGEAFEFWEIYNHDIEPVVSEVWGIGDLSLPKLKIQAIGMLSMEWLENWQRSAAVPQEEIVAKLKPMFYGDEDEANRFLATIQGMKPKQITDIVNKLVQDKKISDLSRKRDLWVVLHDYGLYIRSESNWNNQVV